MSKAVKFVSFFASMAALVLGLLFLNWLPFAIDDKGLRQHVSVTEASKVLKGQKLLLPSYFPERLSWPPFEILAGSRPSLAAVMHFKDVQSGEITLAIVQSEAGRPPPVSRIEPSRILSKEQVLIKGRKGSFTLALCPDKKPCNRAVFFEDGWRIAVTARESKREILLIAQSMLAD